ILGADAAGQYEGGDPRRPREAGGESRSGDGSGAAPPVHPAVVQRQDEAARGGDGAGAARDSVRPARRGVRKSVAGPTVGEGCFESGAALRPPLRSGLRGRKQPSLTVGPAPPLHPRPARGTNPVASRAARCEDDPSCLTSRPSCTNTANRTTSC